MGKSIFNKKLPRSCEYCVFGKLASFGNEVLCQKRGVTEKRDSCRKFKYDCFKRIPKADIISNNYKPEDFEI